MFEKLPFDRLSEVRLSRQPLTQFDLGVHGSWRLRAQGLQVVGPRFQGLGFGVQSLGFRALG